MSENKGPRIILFDLEILADLDEAYNIWPSIGNYPGLTLRADINSIVCCGWKVFGEDEVHCINAWDFKGRWKKNVNDDFAVCKKILEILKGADGFVFHNGQGFDLPFLLTRLELNNLPTIPPDIKKFDTKNVARKLFFVSKSLNHLGRMLVGEEKLEHDGWKLWPRTRRREPEAMQKMEAYCKQDVLLLEKIFKRLMKHGKLPNFGNWTDKMHKSCPNCGSTRFMKNGTRMDPNGKRRQRYQCKDCGTYSVASTVEKADKAPLKF